MFRLVAAIPSPPIDGFPLGPLDIRFYGLLIAVGAYAALLLVMRRYTAFGGDPAVAERAGLVALVAGVVGARVAFILPRLDVYLQDPVRIFWDDGLRGLAYFGGLVFGAAAVIYYVHRKQADLPAMADAVAPALPLAQAIGRWGNYFNQELYGRPTDLPWALEVDEGHRGAARAAGYDTATTFHPTFLYESLWNLLLVAVILVLGRTGRLRRGSMIFVYAIGAGIGRGWIESLRIDTVDRYVGLSRNNWFAFLVLAVGVVGLILWQRRGRAAEDTAEDTDDLAGDEAAVEPADEPEA